MTKHIHSILCLGDSYTVGESVALHESFPYQTLQLLRKKGLHFHAPEIVAKTGWTTFELADHILHTLFSGQYDFVTLLIGVNNQYRSFGADDYKNDFEFLLRKAIHFAGDNPQHVIVLSIPDWSATQHAKEKEKKKISLEIDTFNSINKSISAQYKVQYINITESTREAIKDKSLMAPDSLHPSGKEYAKWANHLADIIQKLTG